MGRLVIASNRVMMPSSAAQAGGVAVALADALRCQEGMWFGWSGTVQDGAAEIARVERCPRTKAQIATLPISTREYNGYYLGYANSVLWPVFHNRVDLAQFEAGFYTEYQRVNRRFAAALQRLLRPDDLVWVHDYHFVPLAKALRDLGVKNRIGFFLHIPFPPAQAFLAIPEHLELAHSLSAYDLVGVQTVSDVGNMIDYFEHGADGRLLRNGRIRVADRIVEVGCFPVGIDVASFAPPKRRRATKGGSSDGLRRLIGVDRLDYTKGLPQKFRAFGQFLRHNPGYKNSVILTQIAAPTRESVEAYSDVRKELESLSGAINGSHSNLDWVPIHYINRSIARAKLPATFRESHVGLVTPLRDGMNLVAKEYVAAQDPKDPGVLILSKFAGAAEQLSGALIVNPYNIDEMAAAIHTALAMSIDERRKRHLSLLSKIKAGDAPHWCASFLGRLARAGDGDQFGPASVANQVSMEQAMQRLSAHLE